MVEFIPHCALDHKPYVGRRFPTLGDAENCYINYALRCGFKHRLGSAKHLKGGETSRRYIMCSREGFKKDSDSCKKRSRMSTRVGCNARVTIRLVHGTGYVVTEFIEAHSHEFVSESHSQFMGLNRNLDSGHKKFVLNCVRANIGPVKSFRLFKELVGGYDKVGCTIVDFKNFARDLRAHAVGVDAQILLNNFHSKREICKGFSFDYCVDSSDKLTRLFWADPISIGMYKLFGEAVSFDATYSTNRYNLIFVPFTGKDNHGKCVTFAAGLISHEDEESYSWMLQKFVDCMGIKPRLIITDQDPALKKAVEHVLEGTRHRLCMWHIMLKVADKVPVSLRNDENFKKDLYSIVWCDHMEPLVFENKWIALMEQYGLVGDKWFDAMFAIRSSWIPAFFKDFELSGLFRTTSMSESENGFFRRYFNKAANLIEFYIHFERAMEAQRYEFDHLNSVDQSRLPNLVTDLPIEVYAASVYTSSTFVDVQKQILAGTFSCRILEIRAGDAENTYVVEDGFKQIFTVVFNVSDHSSYCDCKHFLRQGYLCSHIFCVYKNEKIRSIPDIYILSRWRKVCEIHKSVIGGSVSSGDNNVMSQLYSLAQRCIASVQGDDVKMKGLLKAFEGVYDTFCDSTTGSGSDSEIFDEFYGSAPPDQVDVQSPDVVKTKGSGTGGKRIKSSKEKAVKIAEKPKRRCSKCKRLGHHDARNCVGEPAAE